MRICWFCLLAVPATILAQDPVEISPDYRVEIENSSVRVLTVKHAPHAKIGMHDHPASVAVCLTDLHERLTLPDGTIREVSLKAGDVAYNEAAKHTEENLSDQPLEAVIIDLKPGAPKLKGWPVKLDPVKLDPEHHLVPLENDRVRVLRTILEPHLRSPRHQHPSYVVVYLTELHTTMTLADGRVVDNPRRPGEIAWRDPLEHVTENIGDHTAMEIQVELK
jgi:quercetin dioxygenase-like cupin family protein